MLMDKIFKKERDDVLIKVLLMGALLAIFYYGSLNVIFGNVRELNFSTKVILALTFHLIFRLLAQFFLRKYPRLLTVWYVRIVVEIFLSTFALTIFFTGFMGLNYGQPPRFIFFNQGGHIAVGLYLLIVLLETNWIKVWREHEEDKKKHWW